LDGNLNFSECSRKYGLAYLRNYKKFSPKRQVFDMPTLDTDDEKNKQILSTLKSPYKSTKEKLFTRESFIVGILWKFKVNRIS